MNEEVYIPLIITQYMGLITSILYLFMILLGEYTFFRKSKRKKEKAFQWGALLALYVVIFDLFTIFFALYSGKFTSNMVIETILWVAICAIAYFTMKRHKKEYDHNYKLYEELGRPDYMLKRL